MRKTVVPIAVILQLATAVVIGSVLPLIIGIWLDGAFHTTPWLTLVALVLGIVTAVAVVYRIITQQYRKYD